MTDEVARLEALDAAHFEAESERRIARLRDPGLTAERVERIYDEEIRPLERARLRREAAAGKEEIDLLFVTVGGQPDTPELAIEASPARFVILLATDQSRRHADEVVRRLGLTADRAAVREIGDGKRVIDLYQVVHEEYERRGRPARVGVDLTGGFKPMSAAAAMAAVLMPRARTFYVDSEQLRIHERLRWIHQRRVELDSPLHVLGELDREKARTLLGDRNYGVAAEVYGRLAEKIGRREDEMRAALARGYDLLERLDYEGAAKTLTALADRLDMIETCEPPLRGDVIVAARAKVRANAEGARALASIAKSGDFGRDDFARDESRDLIVAFVRSAEYRQAAKQHDLAALLAYRAVEAIPQRRLALRGLDTGALDWERAAEAAGKSVGELIEAYNEHAETPEHKLAPSALPKRIARMQAYLLLALAFPEDVADARQLKKVAGLGEARNKSILAHGLKNVDAKVAGNLIKLAHDLLDRMLEVEQVAARAREELWARHTLIDVPAEARALSEPDTHERR